MAKRRQDSSPAEDYIDQLNWQAKHPTGRGGWRSSSVRYEPKWKYKIAYRYPPVTALGRIIRALMLAGVILLMMYMILSGVMSDHLEGKIFYGVVFGLIITIVFFAVRDASKETDDSSEDG
jgi:hypothetical protein